MEPLTNAQIMAGFIVEIIVVAAACFIGFIGEKYDPSNRKRIKES